MQKELGKIYQFNILLSGTGLFPFTNISQKALIFIYLVYTLDFILIRLV